MRRIDVNCTLALPMYAEVTECRKRCGIAGCRQPEVLVLASGYVALPPRMVL